MNRWAVEAYDLVKTYGNGKVRVYALRGVDLKVKQGEIVSIVGPSGCGKSTLLNILGGIDKPTIGRVFVCGEDVTAMNEAELAHFRLKKIGIVFQFFNLIPTLTALENVELRLAASGCGNGVRKDKACELLARVGMNGKEGRKPSELSGGEQQRVAIARALANNPAVVLMDEPTGNLDSITAKDLITMIDKLNAQGQTFVIATHDSSVKESTDRVITMRDGVVIDG
ncbi:ABC transporter ATP-binding protein [Candidatus Bathyarchaeota archaeon]|nr:ABC transporter ATP-binding protein [Candidatus Bathyarchaeota archaeon]MBS7629592.1 ABC transporter ATP-binding protein [Candidatus Bathyarchaeota archaeon]